MAKNNNHTKALRTEVERLNQLLQIGRALASDIRLENLMERVAEECAEMVRAKRCFVFVKDRNSGVIWTALFPSGKIIKFAQSEGIEGWVSVHQEYVISDNPHNNKHFSSKLEKILGYPIKNLVVLPLLNYRGETIGILETINKLEGDFTSQDYLFLQAAAAQIAISFENARLYQDIRRTLSSLTEVMAATIDAKHPIAKGHSQRVAKYAVGIAREMGVPEQEIEQIRIASLLHDYGKIGIPDIILKKEGKLSPEEYTAMQKHAKITHDIVSKVHFAEELADVPIIASCHHERWDGEGYPFGLAREAIPLGSRIIAVADCFDAITSMREYKEPKAFEEGLNDIIEESGKQFDPNVVEAFARYYRQELEPLVEKGEI